MTSKHQRATDSVTLKDIYAASQQIKTTIRRTPLDHSQELSALVGAEIRLKMENLQQTGSFKLRGRQTFLPIWMRNSATLASSPDSRKPRLRARLCRTSGRHPREHILPRSADPMKVAAMQNCGARVTFLMTSKKHDRRRLLLHNNRVPLSFLPTIIHT